jgi:hypothetical protein
MLAKMGSIQNPSGGPFEKYDETPSVHSSDLSEHNGLDIEQAPISVTQNRDIEKYPKSLNQPQDVEDSGKGPVTRTSTKSSWKDPGPPPDGGLRAWTQGVYPPFPSFLSFFLSFFLLFFLSFPSCKSHYTP